MKALTLNKKVTSYVMIKDIRPKRFAQRRKKITRSDKSHETQHVIISKLHGTLEMYSKYNETTFQLM